MPKETSCSKKLTPEEIRNATLHHWQRTHKITEIPYSFDLSIISQHTKDEALKELSQTSFDPLNEPSIHWLERVLKQWEKSCGNTIKFTYVDKINNTFFNGVVIANCDNLNNAKGYWQQIFSSSGEFQYGLVCIPSQYYDNSGKLIAYNVRAMSHEIGHAIGLAHLHDVESIRVYLQNSTQGMGCSVMPYLDAIASNSSPCVDMDVCFKAPFAVMPGPFDAQMCQGIYGEGSPFFQQPITLAEMQNYAFGGAAIGYTLGLRSAAEYLFERLGDTHVNARLKVLAIFYSMILLKLVYSANTSEYASLFEQAQQLLIPLGADLCSITLNYLSDYLRAKNMYVLSNTLEITSTSLQFCLLSKGIFEAAKGSLHMTWNYGTAILSGLTSYGLFSSMGKSLVNSFLGPKKVNTGVVEQKPQKSLISSVCSFFSPKSSEANAKKLTDKQQPCEETIPNIPAI